MIDDAKIRQTLLERFPQIEPGRFEMEEYEYGDELGVSWLTEQDEGGMIRRRVRVVVKGHTEEAITVALAEAMANWFSAPVVVEPAVEMPVQAVPERTKRAYVRRKPLKAKGRKAA